MITLYVAFSVADISVWLQMLLVVPQLSSLSVAVVVLCHTCNMTGSKKGVNRVVAATKTAGGTFTTTQYVRGTEEKADTVKSN